MFFAPAPHPKFLLTLIGAAHLPPYTTDQAYLSVIERVTIAFLDHYVKHEGPALAGILEAGSVNGVTFAGGYTSYADGGYGGFGGGGQGGYIGGGGGGGYGVGTLSNLVGGFIGSTGGPPPSVDASWVPPRRTKTSAPVYMRTVAA